MRQICQTRQYIRNAVSIQLFSPCNGNFPICAGVSYYQTLASMLNFVYMGYINYSSYISTMISQGMFNHSRR